MLQWSASIPPGVALPSMGSCTLGWEKTLVTVAAPPSPNTFSFLVTLGLFPGRETVFLLYGYVSGECKLLDVLTYEAPTSGHKNVHSVGTPWRACRGNYGQKHCKTTFLTLVDMDSWLARGLYFSLGGRWSGCYTLVGPGIVGLFRGEVCQVVCRLSLSMWVVGSPMGIWHWIPVLISWP